MSQVTSIPNVDQPGFVGRIRRRLPAGWFPDATPVLDGVLNGLASVWAAQWALLEYVVLQMRLATATDVWLDMAAADFLGFGFLRKPGEGDDAFRARIMREIIRPRATRPSIVTEIADLTGVVPEMVEAFNLKNVGCYGRTTMAYGVGLYGSLTTPFQAFLTAYRPRTVGIPTIQGYGVGGWGYGFFAYVDTSMFDGPPFVSDAEIYAAVASTQAAGCTVWTRIDNAPPPGAGSTLDFDFILDESFLDAEGHVPPDLSGDSLDVDFTFDESAMK